MMRAMKNWMLSLLCALSAWAAPATEPAPEPPIRFAFEQPSGSDPVALDEGLFDSFSR